MDVAWRLTDLEAEVRYLKRQRIELARRIRVLEKYLDTVSSPLYKRLFWALLGYRFRRVGRWYRKTEDLHVDALRMMRSPCA
jgi:hypothetical protein